MAEPSNPLIPVGFDVAWSSTVVVSVVLLAVALISLARAARSLTPMEAVLWVLSAILIPVLGPLAWLFIGRRSAAATRVDRLRLTAQE